MADRPVIHFFTDQNVPDSLGTYLRKEGHTVTRLRDVMATNSPDPIVATACAESELVLITWDQDFKAMAPNMKITRKRFGTLSCVRFNCKEPNAVARMKEALPLIEAAYVHAQTRRNKQIIFSIGDHLVRLHG